MTAPTQIIEGFSLSHAQILDGTETFEEALARTDLEGWDIYGVNEAGLEPDTDTYINEGDDRELSEWSWLKGADVSVQAGYISFPLMSNLTGEEVTAGGGTAEVQTVTITGTPTGGGFTLTYAGQTTASIPHNATAAQVRTALENLSNLNAGQVTVTGGPGPGTPFVVTFDVPAGDVPVMTKAHTFTGGSTPDLAVTTTTPGTGGGAATTYSTPLWTDRSFNVAPKPMIIVVPSRDSRGAPRSLVFGLARVQFRPIAFEGPSYKEGLKINYAGRAQLSLYDETGSAWADDPTVARVGVLLSRPA